METKDFRYKEGITLISLIITIIVLLILAGVSLNAVVGENGIMDQAISAKEKTEQAGELEKVEMAVFNAKGIKDEFKSEDLKASLQLEFETDINIENFLDIENNIWLFKGKYNSYFIYSSGEIEIKEDYTELKIGDYVDYPVYYENQLTNGTYLSTYEGWRILDIDDSINRIRLVSSGCPMTYYVGNNSDFNVYNLTVGFFDNDKTVNESGWRNFGFYKNNSKNEKVNSINEIKELFCNDYTLMYKKGDIDSYINDYDSYELQEAAIKSFESEVPKVRALSYTESSNMPESLRANGAYYWLCTAYNSELMWLRGSGGNSGAYGRWAMWNKTCCYIKI